MATDMRALVDLYVQFRDKRSQIKKDYEAKDAKLVQGMEQIEAVFATHLNESGAASVRTEAGTFFRKKVESVTVAARDTFFTWAKENGKEDLLDIRAAKANILKYKEEAGDLPPGLNYHAHMEIQVRRD